MLRSFSSTLAQFLSFPTQDLREEVLRFCKANRGTIPPQFPMIKNKRKKVIEVDEDEDAASLALMDE